MTNQMNSLPEQPRQTVEFQLDSPNANAGRDPLLPNEKLIETLFNATLLRCFGARISLYTPTTREEYIQGYDGSLRNEGDCREIFLQFKRARIRQDDAFTIDITPHQHQVLQNRAPKTAYYIAATFRSFDEILAAQRDLDDRPMDFLRHYIAIDVVNLPDDLKALQYRRQTVYIPQTMEVARHYPSKLGAEDIYGPGAGKEGLRGTSVRWHPL